MSSRREFLATVTLAGIGVALAVRSKGFDTTKSQLVDLVARWEEPQLMFPGGIWTAKRTGTIRQVVMWHPDHHSLLTYYHEPIYVVAGDSIAYKVVGSGV